MHAKITDNREEEEADHGPERRLVSDQAEYRQWRRSVEAEVEEDTVDSAISSLWEEL